jgi:succinoglycan biosynthesis transport protein ExoP
VISSADPPIRSDGPSRIIIVFVAVVTGLIVGGVLALLLDFMDRSIRTPEQIEHFFGLECLGVVPSLRRRNNRPRRLGRLGDDLGTRRNGYPWFSGGHHATICQALRRAHVVIQSIRELRTVGVTSAAPGEGATTVAINLARLSACLGNKVLIVDSVRRARSPACATLGERRDAVTLTTRKRLLDTGAARGEPVGVDVISIADTVGGDTDAAWLTCIDETLREAITGYDLVIVDLPSLASGPDVRNLAQHLDGLMLVIKWAGTDAELIRRALNLSGGARFKFVGALLNMADERLIGRYGDKFAGAEAVVRSRCLAMETSS